jgi:ABC-type nitrate/sulfonate/bicarbonate transport systems, periplasmic components
MLGLATIPSVAAATLKIGYCDWPGWVAWQIAIDKGWLKEAGLDVEFDWFDYSASLDAFSAGKLDATFATNGDALVIGSGGAKGVMVMVTDYSSGNDMIIGKPGLKSIADLKGKKVGVEVGLVDNLLLSSALRSVGLSDSDVTLVNTKTNDTPQVLASGEVDAIGVWQPIAGIALRTVPGSKPIFTSEQAPGLIYDGLLVSPGSLSEHKAAWNKLIMLWDRVVRYINDPVTQADALKIMSARVGLTPDTYKPLLAGTHLIDIASNKAVLVKGDGLASLYGSTANADAFNIRYEVYKVKQDIGGYIDPSLVNVDNAR